MNDSPTDPPPSREEAIARVVRAGVEAVESAGLPCHVEHSPGSESTYLHVRHADAWRGVRVSCHEPAYDCSKDYEQLLLSEPEDEEAITRLVDRAADRAVSGGDVVADPADVAEAVAKIAAVMADGRVYRDADGTRWRWSSDDESWRQVGPYWGQGPPEPPAHRPNPAVSARIRCQVRHSQNQTAKWAAEAGSSE